MIYTDEILTAAVEAVDLQLADLPSVLGDPTHRNHRRLVAALGAQQQRVAAAPAAPAPAGPPRQRVTVRCTALKDATIDLVSAGSIGER